MKTMKYLCMIALVALAFTSCNKNQEEEKRSSTFRATIKEAEYESVNGDRVYVSPDNLIVFEEGDVCSVFNLSTDDPLDSHCATYEALDEGSSVTFQNCGLGEIAEERSGSFFAFYPGGRNHMLSMLADGENKAKFFVSPTQNYRENKVSRGDLFMFAKGDEVDYFSDDVCFVFDNLSGILQLKPYEAAQRSVTSIQVCDNVHSLTGWVELILPEFDASEFATMIGNYRPDNQTYMASLNNYLARIGYEVTEEGNTVTLNMASPVQLGSSKATTPAFNIALGPLAFSGGGHIVFSFDDGSVKDVNIPSGSFMIKPNVVTNVGLNMDAY